MKISVVIPAFNEQSFVPKAIKALQNQKFPKKDFEIIVVDNNSIDKTYTVAKSLGVKVIKEKNQGTNWARQKGFEASKFEIVAFLDADCIPPTNWLTKINKVFSDPKNKNVGILTGLYYYYDMKPSSRSLHLFADQHVIPRTVRFLHFLTGKLIPMARGGNMIFRRKTLTKIGGLDTSLTYWGDDTDTAKRVVEKGSEWVFDPKLIVYSSSRRIKKNNKILHLKYAKTYLSQFVD